MEGSLSFATCGLFELQGISFALQPHLWFSALQKIFLFCSSFPTFGKSCPALAEGLECLRAISLRSPALSNFSILPFSTQSRPEAKWWWESATHSGTSNTPATISQVGLHKATKKLVKDLTSSPCTPLWNIPPPLTISPKVSDCRSPLF